MSGASCIWTPEIKDRPSILYTDLNKWQPGNRKFINYVYANYIQPQVQKAMDNAGYIRNQQNEHNVEDVIDFLDLKNIVIEMSGITAAELQIGAIDSEGNRVDFTDAEKALKIADDFNSNHKGLIASVVQHGNIFNILVWEKNTDTFTNDSFVKNRLKAWDIYKQAFNSIGIDITKVPDDLRYLINAYNIDLASDIHNLQTSNIRNTNQSDLMSLLLFLNRDSDQVKRLVKRFGSIEKVHDVLTNFDKLFSTLSDDDCTRIKGALRYMKQHPNSDFFYKLQEQINQIESTSNTQTYENSIKETLAALDKAWKINTQVIHLTNNKIEKLSEATAYATILLQRQINKIDKEQGMTPENMELIGLRTKLMKELSSKRYYEGMVGFLANAANYISEINNLLSEVPTGTELEQAMQRASNLQEIKKRKDQYYDLLSALANDNLIIDESITPEAIKDLREIAQNLKKIFDEKEYVINNLVSDTMIQLLTKIIGTETADGISMANVVKMATVDSSWISFLYGIGEQGNYILNAMGHIIRNAQSSRDGIMNDFIRRINRATTKLYNSGSDSSFMYEDDGHIISDIDWDKFNSGLVTYLSDKIDYALNDKYQIDLASEAWIKSHTVERVVDKKSGRTERVPDERFRKPFPNLTPEQKEYYDTMMEIKGEIGTLLPDYAQNQYLPPQLRRKMLDALGDAKNAKDVLKAIGTKIGNIWKIREDDTEFTKQLTVDDTTYVNTQGDYNNTPLREIPIFFVKHIKDQDELLKNFSTGLAALAGTAVNYNAMNSVLQVIEFMGDFAKEQLPTSKEMKAEAVKHKFGAVVKDLYKYSRNTTTERLIDGFINQHFYGQTLREEEQKPWVKVVKNLIAYTSFRGLTTNFKGMMANYLGGMYQIFVEAGCGEFFGLKDMIWAIKKLYGSEGVPGEIMEILSNNKFHKSTLLQEKFDPMQENFEGKSHKAYHKSIFRRILSKDCSFIGYGAGEYLIHMLPMYAILHRTKVKDGDKIISLYDAFELSPKVDGNAELKLKKGLQTLDGKPVDEEYVQKIKNRIRFINQDMHGSMNTEDKGIIQQYILGRMVMNFRQWMVRHYSRRFRGRHFDATLQEYREGYWVSLYKAGREGVKKGWYKDAGLLFLLDFHQFALQAQSHWNTLKPDQKYNIKRVISEMVVFTALLGLSFALGDPDKYKGEFWRRFWIYQTKRLLIESKAAMPSVSMPQNAITIMQSPMACINTLNNIFYVLTGIDDITTTIKNGKHAGENLYWRNVKKYSLPFYKDFEQLQSMDEDNNIFKVLDATNLKN